MRLFHRSAALALAAALAAPASAQTVVKMATLAPDGSTWHRSLQQMGASWTSSTSGRVLLKIYPGGVAGDESDMIRKMRIGQLQGAALSTIGLSQLDGAFNAFAIPLFYRGPEEMRAVLRALDPVLRRRLEEKGFVVLGWAYAGSIQVFSRTPMRTIDDLRRAKIFTSAGDEEWVTWWKANGFHPVPLSTTDVLSGLQTGMIDTYPVTPLGALSLQWFRYTPYMLDVGLAPLLGATVLSRQVWDRISPEDRSRLADAARRFEDQLFAQIPRQDAAAVDEMRKRGLTVVSPPAASEAAWRDMAERLGTSMRGSMIPPDIYDAARRARDAFRSAPAAARPQGGSP